MASLPKGPWKLKPTKCGIEVRDQRGLCIATIPTLPVGPMVKAALTSEEALSLAHEIVGISRQDGKVAPPPGWETDGLAQYFDKIRHNSFATFHRYDKVRHFITDLDGCFSRLIDDVRGTGLVLPLFPVGALGSFRAGNLLVFGTALTQSYAQFRLTLENALYCWWISQDSKRGEVWIDRDRSDKAALRAAKDHFHHKPMVDALKQKHPALGTVLHDLYERCIDEGAHPNVGASLSSIDAVREIEAGAHLTINMLHGDGVSLQFAIQTSIEVAVTALTVFELVFPRGFADLGLDKHIDELRTAASLERIGPPKTL